MFKTQTQTIKLAENLRHVYFEIKCKQDRLHYLKQYLQEKEFIVENGKTYNDLGLKIVQLKHPNNKYHLATLKHSPRNKYQILIQFIGIETPLKKKSITRQFLEELLSVCNTNTLHCGYIHTFKGNVFCHYNNKNFTIDSQSIERYNQQHQIKQKPHKQRKNKEEQPISKNESKNTFTEQKHSNPILDLFSNIGSGK